MIHKYCNRNKANQSLETGSASQKVTLLQDSRPHIIAKWIINIQWSVNLICHWLCKSPWKNFHWQWHCTLWVWRMCTQSMAHHHHHLSLNHKGHWGITDDFATSFLHLSLFSTALWDLANSRPVQSLMLSSYLFLCLPCLLPLFSEPCKMVLARPYEQETWPCHCSYDGQEVFMWSDCLLDLGMDFLIGNMVFAWDA